MSMISRRTLLQLAAGLPALAAAPAGVARPASESAAQATAQPASGRAKTYVLAHGSWHGGWCWRPVAERLRAAGHRVHAPSFTGMGDRAHLLHKGITIDTFVEDLVQVIESEELNDVILVGHSFGGIPISGVADRIPERLAHLVYFDSIVLQSGQNAFSVYPKAEADARIAAASKATNGLAVPIPEPLPAAWGFKPGSADEAWVKRRLTRHPLASYTTPLTLRHPVGNGCPRTYIHCTQPELEVLEASRQWVKSQSGWNWVDIAAPHEAHITHPQLLAELLLGLS
ncbi:alpha/beta hydrolase [Achromobacter xylosoxidans]|uniref:alpha/beta hydrolase n=1 Tax=Alcaligenes xylosoxydans xylosoxydans TaxID=85698 RepID=UPI000AB35EFA|nr:alpha/beta hydrolase [Achromobacter xylosoxidans]MCH1986691.1 alpha/beta hydrolase [Achromobacter xylosoxidans]MCH4587573.1 alpha/beta hydrolase [Achromobacter xylosoxidans]MCZ8383657.1 alpha/beta hydrolase [Achromobacter xylosoxidans]